MIKSYTYNRLLRILKEYDCHLEPVKTAYKANRHQLVKPYNLVHNETGETLVHSISLDSLREMFKSKGYPLEDSKSNR